MCFASTGGIICAVALAVKIFGRTDTVRLFGNIAMAVNMVVVGVTVPNIFRAFIGKNIMTEKLEEFKNGEMNDDAFYNNFILDAVGYLHMNIDDIEREAEKRKRKSM